MALPVTGKTVRRRSLGAVAFRALLYLAVGSGALIFTFPFLWMISSSVKPGYEMLLIPPKWIPSEFEWRNYLRPFENLPFPTFFQNTITIIPIYVLWSKLGFINTFVPLLLPEYLGSPFVIFLIRQYMLTIPH